MLAFYREVLGCALEREQPELGLTQLRAGRSLIDLVRIDGPLGGRRPPGPGRNVEHFCLTLTPFEEAQLIAWLGARGVAVHEPGFALRRAGRGPLVLHRGSRGQPHRAQGGARLRDWRRRGKGRPP